MRLSDLVRLRNNLSAFSAVQAKLELDVLEGQISQQLRLPLHLNYSDSVQDLINHLQDSNQQIAEVENKIPKLITQIEQEINETTRNFLARGYMINGYYGSNSTDVTTERNDRLLPISDDTRSEIIVRLRGYTDWHYPCLEIGPGDGIWTEHLVAGDPLYIVDVHQEFLDSTLSKFNDTYRNRVRTYLANDGNMNMLPNNQFGFIFSWNVFNYFPLTETKNMLVQAFELLRPGGTMMFSYNNCEVPQCVEYVEQGFRSWMPKSLLVETCESLGYEIVATRAIEETVHWIEIRKPGELKTVKAHQVLGKIVPINT
jgi:phospholipid N-methyltransferase